MSNDHARLPKGKENLCYMSSHLIGILVSNGISYGHRKTLKVEGTIQNLSKVHCSMEDSKRLKGKHDLCQT